MSRDQVSGRKYSAIFSMMVCRIESRSNDEVRALATSWKMFSSCSLRSAPVTLVMETAASNKKGSARIICGRPKPQQSTLVTGTCEAKSCRNQAGIEPSDIELDEGLE